MGILYILLPFDTFCVHLVHFFRFWYHAIRSGNPDWDREKQGDQIDGFVKKAQNVAQPIFAKK
jgi:hypothetical protein